MDNFFPLNEMYSMQEIRLKKLCCTWIVCILCVLAGCDDGTSEESAAEGVDTSSADTSKNIDTGEVIRIDFTYPDSPAAYVASDETAKTISYVKELIVPENGDEGPTCCFKFAGSLYPDEAFDNGLAYAGPIIQNALRDDLGNQITFDEFLNAQIESGLTTYLWDHMNFSGVEDADGFILANLRGAFAEGTTFDGAGKTRSASSGQGEFLINPTSFVADSGEPLNAFGVHPVSGGVVQSGLGSLTLKLPIFIINLDFNVSEARVTGTITQSAEGVTYANGTMGGYITEADLFGALNDAADKCACLGLNGADLAFKDGQRWQCAIPSNQFQNCSGDATQICRDFANVRVTCSFISSSGTLLDLDVNGDGTGDALSIGLQWSGVGGAVTGVVP